MKRSICALISVLMAVTLIFSQSALAEETEDVTLSVETEESVETQTPSIQPEVTTQTDNILKPSKLTSNKIVVKVHIDDVDNLLPQNMVFGIYSPKGQFWGARHIRVADTSVERTIEFTVPEYNIGETLGLKIFSGAKKFSHSEIEYSLDEMIELKTSSDIDENNTIIYGNEFSINASPLSSNYFRAYANGNELYFKTPTKIINNTAFIPLMDYLEAVMMADCVKIDENSGRIEINVNGQSVVFYLEGRDMYKNGKVTYSDNVPLKINGVIYVPFRFLVEGLGGTIEVTTDNENILHITALLTKDTTKEAYVNSKGIISKTNYLVWVSRKDFSVMVFTNNGEGWKLERTFPCSIGAPSSPTITGEYEYFSKESRWSYPTYYVGPIMRFYKGYALHSTLLRYDGSDADGRLGQRISHGCVRLAPADIQWMVNTVPLYTKIYITE